MSASTEARRDALFDYAVAHPDGFTIDEVSEDLDWTRRQTDEAIHDLRHFLADIGDTISLPCDPQGKHEQWLYRLAGDLDSVRGWTSNRVRDTEARVRTMKAMMVPIVAATDGRRVDGKKARVMSRSFTRLVEDLDQIMEDDD